LAYPELVRSGAITLLAGLLTHENMDIVIDVIELVFELTDEDADVREDEDHETAEDALKMLVEALVSTLIILTHPKVNDFFQVENSALELLVDNLGRFNEEEEADRQGLFHVLGWLIPCPQPIYLP
jgi:beta-catenin-like protein 1